MTRLTIKTVLEAATPAQWERWLAVNHESVSEVWLRLAKRGAARATVTRDAALEVALCYGWIDGQSRSEGEEYWLQRFTPRTRRSKWSRINCEAAERLIQAGRMKPAGTSAVEAAKADGRWDAAYASPKDMVVPDDLLRALEKRPTAERFFRTLDARNRYAILYRIHDAKKPETRARRIDRYVDMLERAEKIH